MAGKKYQLKIDITGVFLGAFALVVLFYGLTSYVKASAIQIALLECLFFMSFFLVRMLIDNRARLKAALFTFCTSGLFAGLYGLYQFLSGQVDTTWTDTELFGTLTLRVYATFENPNVYGEYLLLVIPVCIAMIFISKRILPRFYYLGVSCLLLVNLALTYSRGCYLALLLSALVVIWFGARKLLSFGVVGLVALPFVLPDNIIARFTSISNLADTSTSYRLNIWRGTMNMLKDFWPLGIGLGIDNFQHIYPLYGGVYAPHAHSLYFQVLSEMGIGGLILLICLCGSILVSLYLAFRRSKKNMARKDKWFALFLLGGILAFLIQGVFDYAWYNYRVLLLFFIVLGIGSAFCSQVLTKGGTVFD